MEKFFGFGYGKRLSSNNSSEDSERIIAVSYWPSQEVLDSVVNSEAYEKVGEKVMASWGDQMIPNHELTFNGKILADS